MSSSSCYQTDDEEEEEDDHLPHSAGLLTSQGHCRRDRKTDKMLKEINKLKRQNVITHYLLGTMIVLTLGWQLSEVSLLLTLKDGFAHPFRTVGNLLKRRGGSADATEEEESSMASSLEPPPPAILGIKMPKFLDISKWSRQRNLARKTFCSKLVPRGNCE